MAPERAHVFGLGASGRAAAKLLLKQGWAVIISDDQDTPELRETRRELTVLGAKVFLGGHDEALREQVDLAVVSPGIAPSLRCITSRRLEGVEVVGELELGFWFTRGLAAAVTGTNGKSTVTALLGAIFKATGQRCFTCGNIGLALSDVALQTDGGSLLAIEVSSFQLVTIRIFRPRVSVLLNVTPDHLNWHGGFGEYKKAKSLIWKNQGKGDFVVYDYDNPVARELVKSVNNGALTMPFSIVEELPAGGFAREDRIIVRCRDGKRFEAPRALIHIPGRHNLSNVLAAATAAFCLSVSPEAIRRGIDGFQGLPHRLEFIRELDGVEYRNDSKATNVDSGRCALEAMNRPVVLIAGGRGKGGGFRDLRALVREKVQHLVLLGECANEIAQDLEGLTTVEFADTLADAVQKARQAAVPGDVVLLSPLAASFDMFRNFEDRGDQFRQLVMGL